MRNLGVINVTFEALSQMLGLPEGVRIIRIGEDTDRNISMIVIESNDLIDGVTFEVQEGCQIPNVSILDDLLHDRELQIYEKVRDELIGAVPDEEENQDEPTA